MTLRYDAAEAARFLEERGFDHAPATAIADMLAKLVMGPIIETGREAARRIEGDFTRIEADWATKTDLQAAKADLQADIALVRADLQATEARLEAKIEGVKTDIAGAKAETASVRTELKHDIQIASRDFQIATAQAVQAAVDKVGGRIVTGFGILGGWITLLAALFAFFKGG